jgi:hypothetical protein
MIRTIDECFFQIQNGVNIKQGTADGGFPITRIETTANDKFNRDRMGYAGITDISKYKSYVLEDGDLLMSHINSIRYLGRTVLYVRQPNETIIHGMNLLRLKARRDVINPAYARYCFYGHSFKRQIGNISKKSVNQASFAVNDLKQIKVEVPPIEDQASIVSVLDKIEKIIELRKGELVILDSLIKARFVELFYDKGYPVLKWNDVFVTTTGKLDSNAAVENGEYPFFTCSKKMLKIDNFAFDQEALLLSGNNAAGKYDVKYYKGKFNAYQRTYILGLKNNWSYQLFRYQLESKLVYLQQQSLGGLTKYLTMKILEKLEFVIPPIEKQLEFETFVYRVDKSKLLSLIKLLEQLITYLYNVFIIYQQDKGEEVERHE